jgi:hypothetical protein
MKTKHAILLNAFKRFSFPIDGIAKLRNGIVAIGDRTVDVSGCNYGYIRTGGISTYSEAERLTACIEPLYNVSEQMFLNLLLPEGANVDRYLTAAKGVLTSIGGVRIQSVEVNKENIQNIERIPASLNEVVRISFFYEYQDVAPCEADLCEAIADIDCPEPCEIPTFCERVVGCIDNLISGDEGNTITTGSDGKLYSTGGGGGSFNCSDLDNCENFQDVKGKADTAVQPSDLAAVATSGDYNDLLNLPTIPAAQVNSDWNAVSGVAEILNKPTIPTLVSQLTNDSGYQTSAQVTAAVNSRIRVFADYVGTQVGNSTTDGILGVILIPAGTFTNSQNFMMQVDFTSTKSPVTTNNAIKILLNTTAAVAGAATIAQLNTQNSSLSMDMQRTIYSKAGNLNHFPNNVLNITNDTVLQNALWQTSAVNWAVDQYFIFTGTTAATEVRDLIAAVIRCYQ